MMNFCVRLAIGVALSFFSGAAIADSTSISTSSGVSCNGSVATKPLVPSNLNALAVAAEAKLDANNDIEFALSDQEKKVFLLQWIATDQDRWAKFHNLFSEPYSNLIYDLAWVQNDKKSNFDLEYIWNKIGPDFEAKVAAIKAKAGFKEAGLSPYELVALNSYTGAIYEKINPALRGGVNMDEWAVFIHVLDHAMSKLPDTKKTVYRNLDLPPAIRGSYQVGAVVDDKAYISTSSKPHFEDDDAGCSSGFGSTVLIISAFDGKSLLGISDFPGEEELLLPRGSKFKIKTYRKEKCFEFFEMEEIPK